ncbi:ABC transporter integral membrane subunit [Bibersteinia trehalosi USDA-ARS-USMARC-188]|uniref:Transport permease protein n=2 Tax=Bibersteinia trehalosi TaxID=47735 RepID=A0A4V7I7Q3_BIBTR|nr:ABC transporter permease [Bibersteinia trehalosi]AGH39206.1 ABC transporter integral membrane subunit [Bibersteinia trehalosi USDA-ARS-USMARC-192]AHG81047.1 ABC transporter integral membrane subunit [Bibersteinia trehalosi USDA-ARS-USMARC-188]AHG83258.1 ABC transporter integral membrane subunit [Bibersteinia trehalosi USDA-ARS-USMARC-189]TCT15858.1 lipopolysaccharide transport system permease protein [Bibersteinia trehalosi]
MLLSKLISSWKYGELLEQLVVKDIKLKYRRSYLGYVWSILNPLLMMMVLVVVFSNIFRFDIPNFPVYLLAGQVIFGFMAEATNSSANAIVENAPLLKKTYLPKYIFTLSKVTSALVNFLFSLIALFIVVIFSDVEISWSLLFFPIVIVQLYIFSLGLSFVLSTISVFFRDIQYLWNVFVTMWMYLTPIFYPVSIIPDSYRNLYTALNPMYHYLFQFREIVLYGNALCMFDIFCGLTISVLVFIIGLFVFSRKQDEFILYI